MKCPHDKTVVCDYLEEFKTGKTNVYPCADCNRAVINQKDHTAENVSVLAGCGLTVIAIAVIFVVLFVLGFVIRQLRPDEKKNTIPEKEINYTAYKGGNEICAYR